MGIKVSVKVKSDTRMWKQMQKRMLAGANKTVKTGWWGTQHPTGVPVAQVAAWVEEGHPNGGMFAGTHTPPRPAIRMGWAPKAQDILKQHAMMFGQVLSGQKSWTVVNNSMKEKLKMELQQSILDWSEPPNQPSTISMKGFNDPWIWTGTTYDSVKSILIANSAR